MPIDRDRPPATDRPGVPVHLDHLDGVRVAAELCVALHHAPIQSWDRHRDEATPAAGLRIHAPLPRVFHPYPVVPLRPGDAAGFALLVLAGIPAIVAASAFEPRRGVVVAVPSAASPPPGAVIAPMTIGP